MFLASEVLALFSIEDTKDNMEEGAYPSAEVEVLFIQRVGEGVGQQAGSRLPVWSERSRSKQGRKVGVCYVSLFWTVGLFLWIFFGW